MPVQNVLEEPGCRGVARGSGGGRLQRPAPAWLQTRWVQEQMLSFPAPDPVHPGRRMKADCRLGSRSLSLLPDIMTMTCLREGPYGEQSRPGWEGQQAQLRLPGVSLCGRGEGVGPPVLPPCHTQRLGLGTVSPGPAGHGLSFCPVTLLWCKHGPFSEADHP